MIEPYIVYEGVSLQVKEAQPDTLNLARNSRAASHDPRSPLILSLWLVTVVHAYPNDHCDPGLGS